MKYSILTSKIFIDFLWAAYIIFMPLALQANNQHMINWLEPSDSSVPLKVYSYYGHYNVSDKRSGVPAKSLEGPYSEVWQSPQRPQKPYHIAVIFPHLKDPYWVAVNYGIAYQANRLGIGFDLFHPGGYRNLGKQVIQMQKVLNDGKYDGLIIGAVQYNKNKLENMYQRFSDNNMPIVAVVNDTYTPTISAKSLVNWNKLGYQAGKFLAEHSGSKKIKVAVMPGPKGTGWAPDSYDGFIQALIDFKAVQRVELLPTVWGDTGEKAQRHQVNFLLKNNQNIDYLVGNALAAYVSVTPSKKGELAVKDKYHERHPNLKIISTYIIQDIYDLIKADKVLAAPADLMKDQGVIAVDLMVRILNGEKPGSRKFQLPFRVGPDVPIVHKKNIDEWSYTRLFGPRGFSPIFNMPPNTVEER